MPVPLLASLIPSSRAIVRVDQWVALAGVVCVVLLITVLTIAAGIHGVRPGRGVSFNRPSTPSNRNLPRHNAAIRGLVFNSSLICCCLPWAASNTMRLRNATRIGHSAPTRLPLQLTPTLRVQNDWAGYAHDWVTHHKMTHITYRMLLVTHYTRCVDLRTHGDHWNTLPIMAQ
jgi:hypothetical protein